MHEFIFRKDHDRKMSLLEFKAHVGNALLQTNSRSNKELGRRIYMRFT